ncbi:MAG: hypothetical protein QOG94_3711, partial [Solirubrobacteraceae bacterium]|nr:hypothetical protein [Solirubrobacteraceae bacterium]
MRRRARVVAALALAAAVATLACAPALAAPALAAPALAVPALAVPRPAAPRPAVSAPAVSALAAPAPAAPAPAAPARRVIVAFVDASPRDVLVRPPGSRGRPVDALLRMLGTEPGLRAGLWSSSQGSYQRQQVLLDISQGARQPTGLYGAVDEDGDGELD